MNWLVYKLAREIAKEERSSPLPTRKEYERASASLLLATELRDHLGL